MIDGQTDGQTEMPSKYRALHCMQSHGKNLHSVEILPIRTLLVIAVSPLNILVNKIRLKRTFEDI